MRESGEVLSGGIGLIAFLVVWGIWGKNGVMNGSMKDGIFREGKITDMSKFDGTEVVSYEKIIPGANAKY